jgi:magnesium transporter
MASMCLHNHPPFISAEGSLTSTSMISSRSEIHDIESLYENYLRESEWIDSEIGDLLDEITNTEENVVLQLDLLRNRILRFELTLSICSFVATCGALATGLFGMNLLSRYETHPTMFYYISAFIFGSMLTIFIGFIKFGKNQRLL